MQFQATERLGAVQSTTDEGFLIAEGVPISRTGVLLYAPGELPIAPGPDGLIRVHRSADDVFSDEAMRSFEGKTVVDLHPGQDVTPANWQRYAVGHVQNVRRGTGDNADKMVADLVVKKASAIAAIRAGKRHVSAGYDATYQVFAPGNAQQKNIRGNHVALVPEGRCGPSCSIGDQNMSVTTGNRTWMDRVRSAFGAQDETMLAAALAEAPTGAASASHSPVFNITASDRGPDQTAEFARTTADALTKLNDSMKALDTRLTGLDDKIKARDAAEVEAAKVAKTAKDEDEAKAKKATKDAEDAKALRDAEDAAAKDKEAKDKDTAAKTGDSAGLATAFQDTLSRAEILIPGVALPTFDAKLNPQATEDSLCAFRRRVLVAAETSGANKAHVVAMKPAGADVATMTCDAVAMTFQAASELAKVANNRAGTGGSGTASGTPYQVPTNAEINARNRARFEPKN